MADKSAYDGRAAPTPVDAHTRALQIMREEYQRMEREMLAHIPHCLQRGHPERAEAWKRGALWCRKHWQETLDG